MGSGVPISSAARPLGGAADALRVDLLRRPDALPSADGSATVARAGALCGFQGEPLF